VPFQFEKFTDTESSFAARITIRQTGQFGFNTGAINRYSMNDFSYCVLYFDPIRKAVGLELKSEQCEGGIEIKKTDSNTYLRAKNFCDRYGIDYSESHRFELRKEEESGFLFFEISKELTKEQGETSDAV